MLALRFLWIVSVFFNDDPDDDSIGVAKAYDDFYFAHLHHLGLGGHHGVVWCREGIGEEGCGREKERE
jgi:hypothetical protein